MTLPILDEIFPIVIKKCKEVISDPLTNIFKMLVNTGYVPSLWKAVNVAAIFKEGIRSAASNFCPISLTLVIGKLLESISARNIQKHVEKYGLIYSLQHGLTKVMAH